MYIDILKEVDEAYFYLIEAIIIQAVQDYRRDMKKILRDSSDYEARFELEEIESFFLSEWFVLLTNVNGRAVLKQLKSEKASGRLVTKQQYWK